MAQDVGNFDESGFGLASPTPERLPPSGNPLDRFQPEPGTLTGESPEDDYTRFLQRRAEEQQRLTAEQQPSPGPVTTVLRGWHVTGKEGQREATGQHNLIQRFGEGAVNALNHYLENLFARLDQGVQPDATPVERLTGLLAGVEVGLGATTVLPRTTGTSLGIFGGSRGARALADTRTDVRHLGTRTGGVDVVVPFDVPERAIQLATDLERVGRSQAQIEEAVNAFMSRFDTYRQLGTVRRSAEGDWRFELNDSLGSLHGTYINRVFSNTLFRRASRDEQGNLISPPRVMLPDVLRYNLLFDAYPELRNIVVDFRRRPVNATGGIRAEFDPMTFSIRVNASNREEAYRNLMHEIQHAVQMLEGFQVGGAVNGLIPNAFARALFQGNMSSVQESTQQLPSWMRGNFERDVIDQFRHDYGFRLPRGGQDVLTIGDVVEGLRRLQGPQSFGEVAVEAFRKNLANRIYLRIEGEVEARMAANRAFLTSRERRRLSPENSLEEEGNIPLDRRYIPPVDRTLGPPRHADVQPGARRGVETGARWTEQPPDRISSLTGGELVRPPVAAVDVSRLPRRFPITQDVRALITGETPPPIEWIRSHPGNFSVSEDRLPRLHEIIREEVTSLRGWNPQRIAERIRSELFSARSDFNPRTDGYITAWHVNEYVRAMIRSTGR